MIFRRIWYFLNRRRLERELEEEMASHRAQMAAEERAGFGSTLRLREEARDAWGWIWLDALAQDVRFGCRMMLRARGFTTAIVAVVSLGIGIALTAFQVFNVLVLRPLPVRAPENVYHLSRRGPDSYSDVMSYPEFEFIRDHNRPLSAVMAQMNSDVQVGRGAESRASAHFVSSNYLSELGAGAAQGRLLDAGIDGRPGAAPAVVLGYDFWRRQFGADPSIVGQSIYVDGRAASVAGVAARQFNGIGWTAVDLWIPIEQHALFFLASDLLRNVSKRPLHVIARLRPEFTRPAAEESMKGLVSEFRRIYPGSVGASQRLECAPAGHAIRLRPSDAGALAFSGAIVLLVLAVSLSNAGALQLSRSLVRAREIWIRSSVGAGRSRIVRQLVTEALLIALIASAIGLLLSYWGTAAILLSLETPLKAEGTLDWRTGAAVIALALCSVAAFGMAPAIQLLRRGADSNRMRGFLIGTQVAASCVLLIVAGLYVRGLQRVLSVPLGFQYRNVTAIQPDFGARGYSPERALRALAELRRRALSTPGILSASVCSTLPLGGNFWIEGVRTASGSYQMAQVNAVEPEYFETMRIAIRTGRNFRPGERNAAIVSHSLAQKAWPGENPLGKILEGKTVIVGVAASARTVALRDGDAVEMYYPIGDADLQIANALLLVRTAGDPRERLPGLRVALTSANEPPPKFELLSDRFDQVTGGTRKGATAISLTGVLTLLIAAMGIGGLLSNVVAQRTREIGVRTALGARSADIVRIVLAQAMIPVSLGLLCGATAGYAVSSLMQSQIYGIGRLDPPTYFAAVCLLLAAATVAAAAPIGRALRVNAVDALRHE